MTSRATQMTQQTSPRASAPQLDSAAATPRFSPIGIGAVAAAAHALRRRVTANPQRCETSLPAILRQDQFGG